MTGRDTIELMNDKAKYEKQRTNKRMFWIDLEMTGLDERADKILEIAVVITDLDFEEKETYHRVVFQPKEILDNMNDWCKNTHGKSGLTALVASGISIEQVDLDLLQLVTRHFLSEEKVVLCGNSVFMDKRFVDEYLKGFAKKLHYRLVDVTSFKEIFRSKYNVHVQKKEGHRALDDIRESINELKAYLALVKP